MWRSGWGQGLWGSENPKAGSTTLSKPSSLCLSFLDSQTGMLTAHLRQRNPRQLDVGQGLAQRPPCSGRSGRLPAVPVLTEV